MHYARASWNRDVVSEAIVHFLLGCVVLWFTVLWILGRIDRRSRRP